MKRLLGIVVALLAGTIVCAHAEAAPPKVYFTKDISSVGLMKAYNALERKAEGKNIAVKISTGEQGGHNFLAPYLIGDLVKSLGANIVECNTAYGGALKNISIGIASSKGKALIHSAGRSTSNMYCGEQKAFLESMAEAGQAVVDSLGGKILYVNVMNRLSVDCDCSANPAEPAMHDISILASLDPVALDQACVDLVRAAPDGQALVQRMDSRSGPHILEYAEQIGLGSRKYELVDIDK